MGHRLEGMPQEDDMIIMDSDDHIQAAEPVMRGRLKLKEAEWIKIGASALVLSWVAWGFTFMFHTPCPRLEYRNQQGCSEPRASEFITDVLVKLKRRGIIGEWKEEWGRPMVISPLKVVPKDITSFRLILDLSRLNRFLRFPRFKYDSIAQVKFLFDQGGYLFTWDLKDGYFHLDMAEQMFTYLCFRWEGKLYYFAQCPMGAAPAAWAFTKLVGAVVAHLRSQGLRCLTYIDDGLGGAGTEEEALRLSALTVEVFTSLGCLINFKKSRLVPGWIKGYLGYLVDTQGQGEGYLMPSERREFEVRAWVRKLLSARKVTPRQVSTLTGHLVSLRLVLDPMALLFTRHLFMWVQKMLDSGCGWDWQGKLTEEAKEEIRIWQAKFNDWKARPLWPKGKPQLIQAQDASDTAVGGWLGGFVEPQTFEVKGRLFEVAFPLEVELAAGRLSREDMIKSSTYRELFAVLFMIRTFVEVLRGSWVRIQADNQALYWISVRGKASDLATHELLVDLFWLCAWNNIKWDVRWVPRELNQLSDQLSKGADKDDWSLNPQHWAVVSARLGPFDCDRFASEATTLLPRFCGLYWSPNVWFVDCYSRPWKGLRNWWHPNPREVGMVLEKALEEGAEGALLLPVWKGAIWWPRLCPDGKHFGPWVTGWLELPASPDLFIRGLGGGIFNNHPPRTRMIVVRISGEGIRGEHPSSFCALNGCGMCRVDL
jgi:hypothetical protein